MSKAESKATSKSAAKAEALRDEVAALEEIGDVEAEIARLEARRRELRGEAIKSEAKQKVAELMPDIPASAIPTEVGDVLDEAMQMLGTMPAGAGCARLQLLMREGKGDDVRRLMREAAIRGKYAAELDGLVAMDFSKLPPNARSIVRGRDAIRRSLLGRMVTEANAIAASGLPTI